jgi:hypothetical protein
MTHTGAALASRHLQSQAERRLAKFGQADKWRFCLTAAKVPQIRSKHDETSTADA